VRVGLRNSVERRIGELLELGTVRVGLTNSVERWIGELLVLGTVLLC
jgi:hypothetical protein